MIQTKDLQNLFDNLQTIKKSDSLDNAALITFLDEVLEILLKMNKMKLHSYAYDDSVYVIKETEECTT